MANDVVTVSQVRDAGDDQTWTATEYGHRMFQYGNAMFGPKSKMYELSVSALCIDVLSQDVSKTPIHLYRRTPNGQEEVRPSEHPVAALLEREPNLYMGPKEFIRNVVANLAIANEHFVAVRKSNINEPLEMAGIQRKNVSSNVNVEARKWFYDITPSTLHEQALFGWAWGRMSNKDVAHIRTRSLNGLDVVSNASVSGSVLAILADMQSFQGGTYSNGGLPKLAFSFPDKLEDKQFERLSQGLQRAIKKAQKDGTPLVLEGNGEDLPKVETLSQSAGDTEFMASLSKVGLDIARYFRVPPHKLYLLENVKYANQAEQERIYVFDTLFTYFDALEEPLSRVLLTEKERETYFIGFDREKAFAIAPDAHQKIIESRWTKGMLTQDEMRMAIGKNALGGEQGQYRLYGGGNFVMVDATGEVVMQAGGAAPAGNDDDTTDTDDNDSKDKPKESGLQLVHSS